MDSVKRRISKLAMLSVIASTVLASTVLACTVLACTVLACTVLACTVRLEAQDGISALRPGQHVRLEGVYSVKQGTNGVAIDFSTEVELLTGSSTETEGETAKKIPLLAATSIVSKFGGQVSAGDHSIDVAKLARVKTKGATGDSFRWLLAKSPSAMGMPPVMATYVTLEDVLPLFAVPTKPGEVKTRQHIAVLGVTKANSELVVKTTRDGDRLSVTRTLQVPDGGLDLGEDKKLKGLVETLTFTVAADGSLSMKGIDRSTDLLISRRGFEYEITRGLKLGTKSSAALDAAQLAQLDKALPDLEGLVASFDSPTFARNAELHFKRVRNGLEDSVFDGFVSAYQSRYEKKFPKPTPQIVGAANARVAIGKPAPDFILKDIEGKPQSFRALTKDKPALLAFWGYG